MAGMPRYLMSVTPSPFHWKCCCRTLRCLILGFTQINLPFIWTDDATSPLLACPPWNCWDHESPCRRSQGLAPDKCTPALGPSQHLILCSAPVGKAGTGLCYTHIPAFRDRFLVPALRCCVTGWMANAWGKILLGFAYLQTKYHVNTTTAHDYKWRDF